MLAIPYKEHYNVVIMLFSWDSNKAQQNLKKHGVSFEIAQTVFDDSLHLSVLEKKTAHEERWITMGMSIDSRILIVIHTYTLYESGKEITRLISARKATKRERKQYEEGI